MAAAIKRIKTGVSIALKFLVKELKDLGQKRGQKVKELKRSEDTDNSFYSLNLSSI